MKKTYITTMPDHIGAFLQASRCFAGLGINISRVSYNKAVDSHTLFIDVNATAEQLEEADRQLKKIGYLQKNENEANIILIEFQLKDEPGSVTAVLELIAEFNFNISYMNYQESPSGYQSFKMGLLIEDNAAVSAFITKAKKLCRVEIIDYNRSEKIFDNSIFYNSFVSSLIEASGISSDTRDELLVNTNLAMQILDEQGLSPYRTFDNISKFADMLASCKGESFSPRITNHTVSENTQIILIEPPCGSNTAIIKSGAKYLFIDSGYAYYKEEMTALFKRLIPEFDTIKKTIVVTHADVDHCGLLTMFDEIIASRKTFECLKSEFESQEGFREENRLHKPYIRICKALTEYVPPDPEKIHVLWDSDESESGVLRQAGYFDFGELHFEVYEGKGGHLPGETVLIDYTHRIVFPGDIYINMKGMTSEQKKYNQYAPQLMTSVDTDATLCSEERAAILQRLGSGKWQIFGAHGMKKEYEISANEI